MINLEKQIGDEIAKMNGLSILKLGLRFDKVVVRLFGNLRGSIESSVTNDETVVVTVTAPIRVSVKTEYEIERQIKDFLESGIRNRDRKVSIFQNEVRLRIVGNTSKRAVKFIGLVHNPGTDSKMLLDLATEWILAG
jgi:hypothetical protein